MKAKNIYFASRLASLALAMCATICLSSCGKDDDNSISSPEERLSEETTPISFTLPDEQTILFDYAGSIFIESDTVPAKNKRPKGGYTLNLRQGKHTLIWVTGLDDTYEERIYNKDGTSAYNQQKHFDPKTKIFSCNYWDIFAGVSKIKYCKKEIEVTPYLMPEQVLQFEDITATLRFIITDTSPLNQESLLGGYLVGFPNVETVGLFDGKYTTATYNKNYTLYPLFTIYSFQPSVTTRVLLCPTNGIDNIQISPVMVNQKWEEVDVQLTTIPKFSVRRGYTTVLRGPLFSGSTSDWTVEMQPYE